MALSSRAQGYIVGNIVMMTLSFVIVATRYYCRIWVSKRGLWWDDLFVLLSFMIAVGFGAVANVAMAHYGWDHHMWDLQPSMIDSSVKAYIIAKVLFTLATTCIRTSMLLFYLWISRDLVGFGFKRVITGMIGLNNFVALLFCLLYVFRCIPATASWSWPQPQNSRCFDEGVSTMITGGVLSLLDIVVNLLPLPIVARLELPLYKRIQVSVILSMGAIATIAGILREFWVYKAFFGTKDITWNALPLWIAADVEIYIGLICVCIPSLKPIWTAINKRFRAIKRQLVYDPMESKLEDIPTPKFSQVDEEAQGEQRTSKFWAKKGQGNLTSIESVSRTRNSALVDGSRVDIIEVRHSVKIH